MTKEAASGKTQREWSTGMEGKLGIYELVEFTPKI
jgi:hypothetical protein